MYLMNVPPVGVTQVEWRTCGPTGGYSLQCFNDSDSNLSTRSTPISDKVQMIIESLRSTQSSLEMGDELEGNVLSGQEGHPQVCKVVGAKSKSKGLAETKQADVSFPVNHESTDSDSDDSVDRGIEEAIMEYLKEKGDNKRKADPCSTILQASKMQRKDAAVPESSAENSDSDPFLFSTTSHPKIVQVDNLTRPAVMPLKKYITNRASFNDGTKTKLNFNESAMTTTSAISEKVEEDSSDSSSDDGIEEAIQRYQLEKNVHENRSELLDPCAVKPESDSTSDDGIEEAIRCYQLKQCQDKSVINAFKSKTSLYSKSLIHTVGSTSTVDTKKLKLKKKKTRVEKEAKLVPPPTLAPKDSMLENQKSKGNGLVSFKVECVKDQPASTPPKVNTTAELMCAEAILDISKTVMPGVFHEGADLSSSAQTKSLSLSSPTNPCPDEESDDSSSDSDDGIELEIRKFLEQKAQLLKQPSDPAVTQDPPSMNNVEQVKANERKPPRLSFGENRKHKEVNGSNPNVSALDSNAKAPTLESLPDHRKDLSPLMFSDTSQAHVTAGLHKKEQSGDKSSSFDSDEDLDTAIKDLLKTKKKTTKKMRDLKRKPRKCLKDEESLLTNASQTKKLKPDPFSKRNALKKAQKIKEDTKDKTELSKKNISQHKQTDHAKKPDGQAGETVMSKGTEGEDSASVLNPHTLLTSKDDESSVDSDDSIEQEIQRFLAERAKGSTSVKSNETDASRNGTVLGFVRDEDIKQEDQLAEIPLTSISTPAYGQSQNTSRVDQPPFTTIFTAFGAQSRLSSVQSRSPGVFEPADGAGAARTEQRRSSVTQDISSQQPEKLKPTSSQSVADAHSESVKWRQSLGLPITDTKTLSRLPFHITSSKMSETASSSLPYPSRGSHHSPQNIFSSWSTKTGGASSPWKTEKTVKSTYKSPVFSLLSAPRQHPRLSFTQSVASGRNSPCPIDGERQSMVHIPKDKSVFVELESNRTNHVQVQTVSLPSQIKQESKSVKKDEREEHLERRREEFVDEADSESDDRRNPEKKQGFSTLNLSSVIDPGLTIKPCIALTTDERSQMFCRTYRSNKCVKGKPSFLRNLQLNNTVQHVKRKLQFRPVLQEK